MRNELTKDFSVLDEVQDKALKTGYLKSRGRRPPILRQRQLVVTTNNIAIVAKDRLTIHYKSLKKRLNSKKAKENDKYSQRLQSELMLIESHFKRENNVHLLAEQLILPSLEEPAEEEYVPIVEEKLRDHYRHLIRVKQLQMDIKILEEIIGNSHVELIFPANINQFVGSAIRSWSEYRETENSAVQPFELLQSRLSQYQLELHFHELQVDEMKQALANLNQSELEIIENKYFCNDEPINRSVIGKLNIYKEKYYQLKYSAILKLARFFKLVQ